MNCDPQPSWPYPAIAGKPIARLSCVLWIVALMLALVAFGLIVPVPKLKNGSEK